MEALPMDSKGKLFFLIETIYTRVSCSHESKTWKETTVSTRNSNSFSKGCLHSFMGKNKSSRGGLWHHLWDEFIQVTFKEVLCHIINKAAEFIHVPSFDMKRSLYVKVNPTIEIVDYFNNPLAHQPIGKYKGRVKMQTKWLVKSQNGFSIKPSISTIFVLHKY